MKKILKCTIFLLIFIFCFYYVFQILWLDRTDINYFYNEPKNSLDIVYIGASNVYNHFNTVLAYDKYGFTTGVLSTSAQPFITVKYLIEEARKYQNPKLYIIDIAKVADELSEFEMEDIRRTTDTMKFSINRLNMINEILYYKDIPKKEYLNYYFSFFMYHNNWKKLGELNFKIIPEYNFKGYDFNDYNSVLVPQEDYIWKNDVVKLQTQNNEILINLLEYIKSNNLNVLFVVPPRAYSDEINGKINDAIKIIQENDFKVINFNTLQDFKIDYKTDLYNFAHLNVYGATKYTLYFSKYLKENYDLPNHKGDEKYSSYESEYKRFKEKFKRLTSKNFDEVLKEYKKQLK